MTWSFVTPLVMLGVYTFVFGIVFGARWGASDAGGVHFALTLFCGLIVYRVFSDCISQAPRLMVGHRNYVKKVIFPLEILPVAALGSALINAAMSFCILVPLVLAFLPGWPVTIIFLPLALLPLCCLSLGLSWFLSSLGVFVRDVTDIVAVLLQALFFMSGVFFPISRVPEKWQIIMKLNPLVHILEAARSTVVWGTLPDLRWWLATTLLSFLVMQLGYAWFMKTRRAFADVI